jgi:hypothetical protein
VVREIIRSESTDARLVILCIAIETILVLIDADSTVLHLDLQITIIGVIPVNVGILANTVI